MNPLATHRLRGCFQCGGRCFGQTFCTAQRAVLVSVTRSRLQSPTHLEGWGISVCTPSTSQTKFKVDGIQEVALSNIVFCMIFLLLCRVIFVIQTYFMDDHKADRMWSPSAFFLSEIRRTTLLQVAPPRRQSDMVRYGVFDGQNRPAVMCSIRRMGDI